MITRRPYTLVLSGGGLKGLAHIGVLRALVERGLVPELVVGSSMGSLVAAAWASGMSLDEMDERGLRVRRRDIFQIAHVDMALRRMLSPAVYRREPLDQLIQGLVGDRTFDDLVHPLLVNTVELHSGRQVMWGLPGLRHARVADAVFASCALPGIFPPREIDGRDYVDGAVVENLPVRVAASLSDHPIVAVNVAATRATRSSQETRGFAATYIRGLEIVMQVQIRSHLRNWAGPPLLLVEPRVEQFSMFAFDRSAELIEEGYRSMHAAIEEGWHRFERAERGLYPRRRVRLGVDAGRCTACGLCIRRAPDVFAPAPDGRAVVVEPIQTWSPLDGDYVRDCPARAISADPIESVDATAA